jgi:hypothetical protein
VANDLDRNLREWADAMMNYTGSTVPPVHHDECRLYVCHRHCEVLWTEIMQQVGESLRWVVDDMNAGNANPEHVIREGRDD